MFVLDTDASDASIGAVLSQIQPPSKEYAEWPSRRKETGWGRKGNFLCQLIPDKARKKLLRNPEGITGGGDIYSADSQVAGLTDSL